jgi:hypothetical protein
MGLMPAVSLSPISRLSVFAGSIDFHSSALDAVANKDSAAVSLFANFAFVRLCQSIGKDALPVDLYPVTRHWALD